MRTPRCFSLITCGALGGLLAIPLFAVNLPYQETFEGAELGLTRSPYNGIAGSGVNESLLPESPTGWVDGPPVSATSQASPWSIAEVAGNRYLRLEGPAKFDGNGLAYAGFSSGNVPSGDTLGWEVTVEFRIDALGLNGNNSTLGLGLGAGARRLFTSPTGGNFGRDEGYMVEAYFEAVKATDLAAVPVKLRILRSTGSPLEVAVLTGPTGFFDFTSTYRLTLRGVGEGTARRITASVENLTFAGSPFTLNYLDETPLAVAAFGLRNRSASFSSVNHLLALDVRFDNFAVVPIGLPDLTPLEAWRQTHFGTTSATGTAAPDADPDGDGIPNAWEYALGRNPTVPDAVGPVAQGVLEAGASTFSVEVRVRADDPDLVISLERAASPAGVWTAVGSVPVEVIPADSGFELRRYRDSEATGTATFYRLSIHE